MRTQVPRVLSLLGTDGVRITTNHGENLVQQTVAGGIHLDVRLQNETIWLTQSMMADLFACSVDNVSLHLRNIYEEGELDRAATSEDFSIVRPLHRR